MEYFYFLIVLLFLLAIADLVVGVSNDAVNFLNSAVGSKVAPYKYIIIVAIAGIILGAMFSSGIMEIARKGIFYPQLFTFDKILIVFLAVMLTDIVLLDVFNTLGLPTSTTVSIVFELLGAALVTGFLFSMEQNHSISTAFSYINFGSTANIISGIFLSIVIAFSAGVLIQYLCRLLFTFQYQKRLAHFGAIFSGIGLTAIVYFLLIKGLKGTTIISQATAEWISSHTTVILAAIFVFTTFVCFVLQKTIRLNPLKVVVLAGTFSLAMAFAGNDLVNFIGVPITGFIALQHWKTSGVPASEYFQDFLAGNDVVVPNYMLLISGVVMALTIWLSAKAKKVTETEVSLGRQDEGDERFKPNAVSRSIVNSAIMLGNVFKAIIPRTVSIGYHRSLKLSKLQKITNVQEPPAFDLVRASSNLVVASVIIAWATSMKLPLSTTYVSFMVAMGSSLADNAWGRESAVYRVAGVLSVIGGWFITAIIAFSVAGLFALILFKGGQAGTIILALIVATFLVMSQVSFNKKEKRKKNARSNFDLAPGARDLNVLDANRRLVIQVLHEVAGHYKNVLHGIGEKDVTLLQSADRGLTELHEYSYKLQSRNIKYIKELQSTDSSLAELLLYTSDFVQDILQSSKALSHEALYYLKNLHDLNGSAFLADVKEVESRMMPMFEKVIDSIENPDATKVPALRAFRSETRAFINHRLASQIEIISKEKPSTRLSILITSLYLQSRDIQAVLMRVARIYQKFDKRHSTGAAVPEVVL